MGQEEIIHEIQIRILWAAMHTGVESGLTDEEAGELRMCLAPA